tara:strand:+ start:211 stop:450 length:240 start_codon:yes stop_codon:yes gene_type:complete
MTTMTRIDVKMLNSKELKSLKNMINDELNFRDSIGNEIHINEIHIKEINELQQQNYDVWLSADEWSNRVGEEDDRRMQE